ncbi:MAG TPA: hypothetical protein VJT50_02530 [Pyrinomonadaceae bacterium]|nr:hypothetical protein [Pyrinomonadaceae bacterium]
MSAQRKPTSKRGINAEALAEAKKLTDTYFKKCPDGYYVNVNETIYLWKGFHSRVKAFPLSAADRLNGIQYRGMVRYWSDARRMLSYTDGRSRWGEWWEGEPIPLELPLMKKSGQWSSGKGSAGGVFGFDWTRGKTAPELFPVCLDL